SFASDSSARSTPAKYGCAATSTASETKGCQNLFATAAPTNASRLRREILWLRTITDHFLCQPVVYKCLAVLKIKFASDVVTFCGTSPIQGQAQRFHSDTAMYGTLLKSMPKLECRPVQAQKNKKHRQKPREPD